MEFGHVYGTKKLIYMPIEVGVLLYDQQKDTISSFQEKFKKDITVEMWKNSTDDLKRTTGSVTSCANLAKNQYELPYEEDYTLQMEDIQDALQITWDAYKDLNVYLKQLSKAHNVDELVFFAKRMEMVAFDRAQLDVTNYQITDIQDNIKKALNMDKLLSLDRASYALDITINNRDISSKHFEYRIPKKYEKKIKPHRALGDAARIFLLYKEYNRSKNDVKKHIRSYFKVCRANESHKNKST